MTPSKSREGRRALGLSQAALARLFEASRRTVIRWEMGDTHIAGPAKVLMRWLAFGQKPTLHGKIKRKTPSDSS